MQNNLSVINSIVGILGTFFALGVGAIVGICYQRHKQGEENKQREFDLRLDADEYTNFVDAKTININSDTDADRRANRILQRAADASAKYKRYKDEHGLD